MADLAIDKKLKLANTKKRFKELQELKKKRNDGPNQNAIDAAHINKADLSCKNTSVENQDGKPAQDVNFYDNVVNMGAKSGGNHVTFGLQAEKPQDFHSHDNRETSIVSDIVAQENTGLKLDDSNDISTNLVQENIISSVVNPSLASPEENWPAKTPDLPNYFSPITDQAPAEFFDNISPQNIPEKPQGKESPSLLTYFSTSENAEENSNAENIGLPKYFDNINSSSTIWENTMPENRDTFVDQYALFPKRDESNYKNLNPEVPLSSISSDDVLSQDDPEIKQNEIQEYAEKSENSDASETKEFNERNLENIFSPTDTQKLMDYLGTTGATEDEKTEICATSEEIQSSTELAQKEILHSNSESLKQLSDQLAHMIEPDYNYTSAGSITDLEKRNIELAATLEKENLNCEQLRAVNALLQTRITQLEVDLTKTEVESNFQKEQEVLYLKNELQAHLQTIGLLVAEKTELSSNLSQYEMSSRQKISECEELQARLKASRSRVADLERELNNLKSEKCKTESMGEQYSTTLENLRQEYRLLKEQKDELAQDLLEVREKLKNTQDDNVRLQQENKDLSSKLSLADIKIQQLSSGGSSGVESQVEQLVQEKFSLEGEIANLRQMLKSIIKERDESTVQYQQYAQQLNGQISNLSSKLEQIQKEKETLLNQEQNRIKHIGELERQLQNIQNDQVSYATRNSSNSEIKNELENFREMCVQLQIEKTTSEENFTKVSNEKELLMKELLAKTDSISQLETMIEQLRGNQPDSAKLLATMESDKVAASRAIQQNKELKQQLESMQEVFMKMDNDKVVLTENLKGQQQTNKDLIEKLQKTELTLQSLADAIEIKDKELTHLRENSEEMNRQALNHEQLEDRLRHYEAHDNSAHILQHELQEAKQTIIKLTNELNKKKNLENKEEHIEKSDSNIDLQEAKRKIMELTNELNKLKTPSEENTMDGIAAPQEKLDDSNTEIATEIKDEVDQKQDDVDRNKNILDKENAMKYLEEKVKRTMQEIADLTDEKQRLEHIVLQLQGETETIGEYVALYQHQRMVLKQKALEKDQQLKQLANDREQIKVKLDRLNQLIKKLVIEKGAVPPELIQHQESMNSQYINFCEEHSKMNEEITKITHNQSNVIEPESEKEDNKTTQTAEEIITLLSEIKSSNLVQPDENFHHCPWCSGQLITV